MTEVVAVLLWDGDRFLACQRPAHKDRGLLWEFPGGKVEPGETGEAALVRECREELGITVAAGDCFRTVTHSYPDLTIRLSLYHAAIVRGTPRLLEHADLRWLTVREADVLPFCPADTVFLEALRGYDRQKDILDRLEETLFSLRDEAYGVFQRKLLPDLDPETVLGVRTPALRALAKKMLPGPDAPVFLRQLPHRYYEENNLHGALLSAWTDFDAVIPALDRFLPWVDNWATCDSLSPRAFRGRQADLLPHIDRWLASAHPFTVRFGILMLMKLYLDSPLDPACPDRVAAVKSRDYYVRMMAAWYFATALAKHYDAVLPYLEENRLEPWTHNKAIQKAVESRRITDEQKAYLRTLRRRDGA